MKNAKRAIALLLVFILLFMTSCSKIKNGEGAQNPPSENAEEQIATLQLLYCASDTLNPFNTKNSLNQMLGRLLFEPLFAISNEFEAIPVLAESISLEEKTYTVRLISAKFSDGSPVTALLLPIIWPRKVLFIHIFSITWLQHTQRTARLSLPLRSTTRSFKIC